MKINENNMNIQAVTTSARTEKAQKVENRENVSKAQVVQKNTAKVQRNEHGDTFERTSGKAKSVTYNKLGKVSAPTKNTNVDQSKKLEKSHVSQNMAQSMAQSSVTSSVVAKKPIEAHSKAEKVSKVKSISGGQGLDVRA